MTASGLHCLLLARDRFAAVHDRGATAAGAENPVVDEAPAIARAEDWLRQHFSVRENTGSAYQEGRLLYGLYALERAGDSEVVQGKRSAHGLPDDWYRQGAAFLLSTQHDDGSWDDGAETPIPNTCFSILFLSRSTEAAR
jgi:hypothetical protein